MVGTTNTFARTLPLKTSTKDFCKNEIVPHYETTSSNMFYAPLTQNTAEWLPPRSDLNARVDVMNASFACLEHSVGNTMQNQVGRDGGGIAVGARYRGTRLLRVRCGHPKPEQI